MVDFPSHDPGTAPAAAREMLEQAAREMGGRLPNLYRYMAESPELLEGYRRLRTLITETSLAPVEQELVQLVVSFENDCGYCMAGHSMRAKALRMDAADIAALRAGEPVSDPRLEALRRFTRAVVRQRGHLPEEDVAPFLAAGFTRQNVLEVILAIAAKVLTNYTNHIVGTPLNDFLEPFAWKKSQAKGAS